ncbi:hypothetical protein FRC09_000664 [Ceratobasidium sp. 395]|nr:hypothetical protein FRC09_000664 [Ceratobasidium sp. 395]
MVQYNSPRRKGRSLCQKAQVRALAHPSTWSHGVHPASDVDRTNSETTGLDQTCFATGLSQKPVHNVSSERNTKFNDLKRLYKNPLQRERRAKSKTARLQDATDFAYEQLSSVYKERDNAEHTLEALKQQEHISKKLKELVRISLKIDKQNHVTTNLEAHAKETYQAKEALRKKVWRRDCKDSTGAKSMDSESDKHTYSLKDKKGVIRPEIRDMLRQLACKGVTTEHISGIINIIANGLGIQVVGLVSARSVAQIMLEGLIQARMQVAHELDKADSNQKRFQELLQHWKKTADQERRAVPVLKAMSTETQLEMLSSYLDNAVSQLSNWRELPAEKQSAFMHDAWLALALQIGEDEFQKLSPESQFEVDFFAWTGCCMHKELNAVKGGVSQMSSAWDKLSSAPPIPLKNKFEATKSTQPNAEDKHTRGGIKLASLAGALFNNKDDKKGYQTTVDDFFKKTFGYSSRFLDTSNTGYRSYCDAATELILHTETYVQLLEAIRDSKCTPGFTNIEANVYCGLQDTSTLTELAILSLYALSVGRPYMRKVRSGSLNALELGSFHNQVKAHCRAIIQNPELLLSPEALATTGTLDGESWDRPEVIYRVTYLASRLPSIRLLLVAFFEGALGTWERFTTEFDNDSIISQATPKQRQSAWMTPTNDISEGALGQWRQMLRRAPNMTDDQCNAQVMLQKNNTYEWSQRTLTDDDEAYIRHEARSLDASGANQKIHEAFTMALEERAAATRVHKANAALQKPLPKRKSMEFNFLRVWTMMRSAPYGSKIWIFKSISYKI